MKIEENISLADMTTFKVGGYARYFCVARDLDDLKEALAFAEEKKMPVTILGGGSNILVNEQGFDGLVVKMEMKGIKFFPDGEAEAFAGENWDDFVKSSVSEGYWGLENLSGIPGTVGGSPVQNIGAYGVEISSVIDFVEVYDSNKGALRKLSVVECEFGYRDSMFKKPQGKDLVILYVRFKLSKKPSPVLGYKDLISYFSMPNAPEPTLENIRKAVLEVRAKKFPSLDEFGTAGSFFKNPIIKEEDYKRLCAQYPELPGFPAGSGLVKISLAWVLDNVLGFKGKKEGHVSLFEKQPLVLVVDKNASSEDVVRFSDEIAKAVFDKTGIKIEREVRMVGF
jgi:UDP-N-acetylmuramate dehydrogenase